MRPGGLAEVEAARTDGRWATVYESQRNATAPDDLIAALRQNPGAERFFEQLGKTGQCLAVVGLLRARTPETRAARLHAVITKLEAGQRVK